MGNETFYGDGLRIKAAQYKVDCKTVVFFAIANDGPYSNGRSGASVKTAREIG